MYFVQLIALFYYNLLNNSLVIFSDIMDLMQYNLMQWSQFSTMFILYFNPTMPEQDILKLIECISQAQSNQSIAKVQTSIIALVLSQSKSSIPKLMNSSIHSMPDPYFQHVFMYLINDQDFIAESLLELIQWSFDILCPFSGYGFSALTHNKKLLFMDFLLNTTFQPHNGSNCQTIVAFLISSKCRTDLNLCHQLLFNVNSLLQNLPFEQLNSYSLTDLTLLSIRVIKAYSKLPSHLIDQALKFISTILLPKNMSTQNQVSSQFKQIIKILFGEVVKILQTPNKYTIGNAYMFIGYVLHFQQKLKTLQENPEFRKIFKLCADNFSKIFPNIQNLNPNALEDQIEKLYHFYTKKNEQTEQNQTQKEYKMKQLDYENNIELKNRIQLLKGCSGYLNNFFLFSIKDQQGISQLLSSQVLNAYFLLNQSLSYCNDIQIFANFIETFSNKQLICKALGIELSFTQEHIINKIIQNCPTPLNLSQQIANHNEKNPSKIQIDKILKIIQITLQKSILQGNLKSILRKIQQNVENQYDHAFNQSQFQSACNTLTLIFKISLKISQSSINSLVENQQPQKQTQAKTNLSKDNIIEWIKMLLNLNESCLPKFRAIIVDKTYQLISEVLEIILPGNHYLQEVIEEQLIVKSFPNKKLVLQRLISLYQRTQGTIFQSGYKNKLEFNRYQEQFNELFKNSNLINDKQSLHEERNLHFTDTIFRKWKIYERIFKKLEDHQLTFIQRTYLWKIVERVYCIGGEKDALDLSTVAKLFSTRPEVLFSRHFIVKQSQVQPIKDFLSLKTAEHRDIHNQFRKHPIFYRQELKMIKNL